MKKSYILFFLILFTINSKSSPVAQLQKANDFYKAGNFDSALFYYQSLIDSGLASTALFYNLGNTYYKKRQYDLAILWYERAKLLSPEDEDVAYNLQLANRYVVDKIETLPSFFITDWIKSLALTFNSNVWAIISLATFLSCLILFLLYLFSQQINIRKTAFGLSIFLLFISGITFYLGKKQQSLVFNSQTAIITTPVVTVKSTPDESGNELFVIHEGLKVSITDSIGGWTEIKLPDGNKGWMKSNELTRI